MKKYVKKILIVVTLISGVVKIAVSQTWNYINAGTNYNVHSVSFINDYTGYIAGGVWSGPFGPNLTFLKRTDNGGQTFTSVFDSSGSTPICQMHFFTPVSGLYRRWE